MKRKRMKRRMRMKRIKPRKINNSKCMFIFILLRKPRVYNIDFEYRSTNSGLLLGIQPLQNLSATYIKRTQTHS